MTESEAARVIALLQLVLDELKTLNTSLDDLKGMVPVVAASGP